MLLTKEETMTVTPRLLARLSDGLLLGGASSLFLTFLVSQVASESTAQIVFALLVVGLVAGVWIRLRLWDREQ